MSTSAAQWKREDSHVVVADSSPISVKFVLTYLQLPTRLPKCFLPPAHFWKAAGGIVWGSIAVSAVSTDVLPYISVATKASFLKFAKIVMCNMCKTNIAKMYLDFFFLI